VGKVDRANAKALKEALKKASIKLPTPCKVVITKGKEITSKMGL
jgi:large subunit ribosomal protein L10e